jgi:hypothetical protein
MSEEDLTNFAGLCGELVVSDVRSSPIVVAREMQDGVEVSLIVRDSDARDLDEDLPDSSEVPLGVLALCLPLVRGVLDSVTE